MAGPQDLNGLLPEYEGNAVTVLTYINYRFDLIKRRPVSNYI
jgi:hypothetical protein